MASANARGGLDSADAPADRLEILTPERVALDYALAGLGSRGAAALVDGLLQGLCEVILLVLMAVLGALLSSWNDFGFVSPFDIILAIIVTGQFLVLFGYFAIFESVWSGQTPGKRLLGIRVIRENGYPLRARDAVIRNLVRVVDLLPTFYLVGVVSILLSGRSKRLGDFAAGSLVVRERAAVRPDALSLAGSEVAPRVAIREQDEQLIRGFMARRELLEPAARNDLARRIATGVAQRNGLQGQLDAAPSAEAFLDQLV